MKYLIAIVIFLVIAVMVLIAVLKNYDGSETKGD